MPGDAGQHSGCAVRVRSGVPDRHPEAMPIEPLVVVLEPDTVIDGKAPRHLPAILQVALVQVARDARDGVEIPLQEPEDASQQQVGIRVPTTRRACGVHGDGAIRGATRRLEVGVIFGVKSRLESMGTPHLGQIVRKAGHGLDGGIGSTGHVMACCQPGVVAQGGNLVVRS